MTCVFEQMLMFLRIQSVVGRLSRISELQGLQTCWELSEDMDETNAAGGRREVHSCLSCDDKNAAVFCESFSNSRIRSRNQLLPFPFFHLSPHEHGTLKACASVNAFWLLHWFCQCQKERTEVEFFCFSL